MGQGFRSTSILWKSFDYQQKQKIRPLTLTITGIIEREKHNICIL